MNNLNLDVVIMREFPVVALRLRGEAFMISHDEEEPKTIQHALSGPKAKELFESMKEEMNLMELNRV